MSDNLTSVDSILASQQHTPSLLVVGGTQRGGTSMLMRFLNTHPAINLYPYEQRFLSFYDLATYIHLIVSIKKFWLSGISRGKHKIWQVINGLELADKASRCPYESFVDVS